MAKDDGGAAQLRFGRQHFGIVGDIGAFDAGFALLQAALRRIHRRLCGGDGIAGMRQFLARHGVGGERLLAAAIIVLRLG